MTILTRKDLDAATCEMPGCDHSDHEGLYLTARCHPRALFRVKYEQGILTVSCGECRSIVAEIATGYGVS